MVPFELDSMGGRATAPSESVCTVGLEARFESVSMDEHEARMRRWRRRLTRPTTRSFTARSFRSFSPAFSRFWLFLRPLVCILSVGIRGEVGRGGSVVG